MKILLFFLSLISFVSNAQESINGIWNTYSIPTPSLNNNCVGYQPNKQIGIYLPPSYQKSKKRYPVIYFLEGYGGRIDANGYVGGILDSLIIEKQVSEVILVQISGDYNFRGSFYANSPVTGNWEDFVVKDVVNYIDDNFRTLAKRESRGLAGMSMGGFGVLNLSMLHPEVFASAYAMSPGVFDEKGLSNCQVFREGGTVEPVLALLDKLESLSVEDAHKEYLEYVKGIEDWNIEFTLAYGMCFAPNTKKAPYFDYPISIVGNDTIVNNEVWKKWESGFGGLVDELSKYESNLRELKLLTIDCGYNDDFKWIVDGSLYYSNLLQKKRISHNLVLHQGDHGSRFTHQMRHSVLPNITGTLIYED